MPKSPSQLGFVAAWEAFSQSSGQVLTNQISPGTMDGQLGATSGSEASDPTWVTGGLSLDGGDHVVVADHASLNLAASFTLFVVFKAAAQASKAIASQWGSSGGRSWWCGTTAGGKLIGEVSSDGGAANIKNYTSSLTAADNTWRTAAIRLYAGVLSLFVGGVLDTNPTKTTDVAVPSLFNSTGNLLIGADGGSGTVADRLTGIIAAVAVGPAVSDANVGALNNYYAAAMVPYGVTLSTVPESVSSPVLPGGFDRSFRF
jgi:hypothetical protein